MNLIAVGLASYNFRQHVASYIPVHGQFVSPENLQTQEYITTLDTWSGEHKMKLNEKKFPSLEIQHLILSYLGSDGDMMAGTFYTYIETSANRL